MQHRPLDSTRLLAATPTRHERALFDTSPGRRHWTGNPCTLVHCTLAVHEVRRMDWPERSPSLNHSYPERRRPFRKSGSRASPLAGGLTVTSVDHELQVLGAAGGAARCTIPCARASCIRERAVGHPSVPQRGTQLARSGRRKAHSQTPTALPRRTVHFSGPCAWTRAVRRAPRLHHIPR